MPSTGTILSCCKSSRCQSRQFLSSLPIWRSILLVVLFVLFLTTASVSASQFVPVATTTASVATLSTTPESHLSTRPFGLPQPPLTTSAMANNTNPESSVLSELKETIRIQAQEIEALKAKALSTSGQGGSSKSHQSHHHGGGGDVSEEDLAKYLRQPFYKTSLSRVGWLGIFLSSLSATAVIMNTFEHTLEKHIELSYFVPLLAGHGGNTGGQTIGTILSALSSGAVQQKDAGRVIMKEATAGMMSGLILGSVVSPIAYKVLGIPFHIATVLFCTMPLVSTIASTLGASIPFACVFAGLDPSVIAAPAMTSIVDICGLMSYFLIANQIFKLYGLEL